MGKCYGAVNPETGLFFAINNQFTAKIIITIDVTESECDLWGRVSVPAEPIQGKRDSLIKKCILGRFMAAAQQVDDDIDIEIQNRMLYLITSFEFLL